MTMSSLIAQSALFQEVLRDAAASSADIARHISEAVTHMQFQDLTKQNLDHVIDGMALMEAGLDDLGRTSLDLLATDGKAPLAQEWIDRLLQGMTLSEMRQRLLRRLLLEGTALDAAGALEPEAVRPYGERGEDDDIELF